MPDVNHNYQIFKETREYQESHSLLNETKLKNLRNQSFAEQSTQRGRESCTELWGMQQFQEYWWVYICEKLLGAERLEIIIVEASTGARKAPVLTRQNGKPHDSKYWREYRRVLPQKELFHMDWAYSHHLTNLSETEWELFFKVTVSEWVKNICRNTEIARNPIRQCQLFW